MKLFLIFTILFNTLLLASNTKIDAKKKARTEKQIKIEMEKEKKYAREQTFYQAHNYDLKGAEVNPDSIDAVPDIEVQDDFDMDSVYD